MFVGFNTQAEAVVGVWLNDYVNEHLAGLPDTEYAWRVAYDAACRHFGEAVATRTVWRALGVLRGAREEWSASQVFDPPLYEDVDGEMKPASELSPEGYRRNCRVTVERAS